jgi:hypothetical protein
MKCSVFWDIMPCIPLKVNWRFGGTCRLHFRGRIKPSKKLAWSRQQAEPGIDQSRGELIQAGGQQCSACYRFHAGFFDSEDGGDLFLRNVRWLSTQYTALYPRRQNCWKYATVINYIQNCIQYSASVWYCWEIWGGVVRQLKVGEKYLQYS